MEKQHKFSRAAQNLVGQPMFKLLAKAREVECGSKPMIHFEIGDPNFISPDCASAAVKDALDNKLTHYVNSKGTAEFIEAISNFTNSTLGFKPEAEQIVACPANALIDFIFRCLVNPGEEIICPDPGFPTYYSSIKYNGMVCKGAVLYEDNSFSMTYDSVLKCVTDKTKLIVINTPNNPTGSIVEKEEIIKIFNLAEERDIYILSDEVYSTVIYDKIHYSPCVLDQCKKRIIMLNSLSKSFSMSGWRLGYAIAPVDISDKIGLFVQTILSCLPPFTQSGGAAILNSDKRFLDERMVDLRKRRDLLVGGLNSLDGVKCVVPEGAFYCFANIKGTGMSSDEWCEMILKESHVCILPGNCFGGAGDGYVRLSYGSASIEEIEEAVHRMKKVYVGSSL